MKKPNCTLTIFDEVKVKITGLQKHHLDHFLTKYGLYVPGYQYRPMFKLGRWDGKVRFFFEDGRTYLYLLEEIIPLIHAFGYSISFEDKREGKLYFPDPIKDDYIYNPFHNNPITLRYYQVDAVNKLLDHGNGIVVASTRSGKTYMCTAMVKAYNSHCRSITIVPNTNLLKATLKDYLDHGLDAGEYSGEVKDISKRHVVSTWQSLQNATHIIKNYNMIICDEVHGAKAEKLQEILIKHAAHIPYRFGFTGTMPKDKCDHVAVNVAIGPIRYEIPAKVLISEGILSTIQIHVHTIEEPIEGEYEKYLREFKQVKYFKNQEPKTLSQFKRECFVDYSHEKKYLHKNEKRNKFLAKKIKEISNKGNTLVLVDSVELTRTLSNLVEGSLVINGEDVKTTKAKQEIYDSYLDKNNHVVFATVNIAGTGITFQNLFNVVLIDIGKSFTRVIQSIGRGLGKNESYGKDHLDVYDFSSDVGSSMKHRKERQAYYTEAGYPYKKIKDKY